MLKDKDYIRHKLENSVSENLYFHMKEMKKKTKWYKKPFYFLKAFRAVLLNTAVYAFIIFSFTTDYIPGWFIASSFFVFLLINLFIIISIEEKHGTKIATKYLKNMIYLNMGYKYLNYLDEFLKTTISLETIKSLSKDVEIEEFQFYLDVKNGDITYYNVFPDYISNLKEEIKSNKYYEKNKDIIKFKKEKGSELLKMIYKEMENK